MKKHLDDKLKDHRGVDKKGKFYQWLGSNCVNAKSHTEVRQILGKIKKPIRKIVSA